MVFLGLAFKSLISRRGSVVLTCLAMTVSIFVILGVEHIRTQAKESFYNTEIKYDLQKSALESISTVSLPYHENMTKQQVNKVIENVKKMART